MNIFELKNLTVEADDKKILKNINLTITENTHLTLTGPSGSGKSTLLKVLSTLQSYSAGSAKYLGKELSELEPISYRREVSYCFQQPVLFGETVRDNMIFPFELRKLPFDEPKVLTELSKVNLTADFLNQEISKLSGGEKQRVALVRNLIFEPKVLLLDEVTTGLDADNKAIVRALIEQSHANGATILEVTHDESDLTASSNLLMIENGELKGNE